MSPLASEQEFRAHVGKRIRRARLALSLSQEALAALAGASKNALCSWELGLRTPTAYHLARTRDAVIRAGAKW